MNAVAQSARGASAFTIPDYPSIYLAGAVGITNLEDDDAPECTWSSLIDELLRIRKFEDDWDGEGTEAPNQAIVDGAITLAQHLESGGYPPAERVHASFNGTIYFEWHTPLGYQEIEVTAPDYAECRWVPQGSGAARRFGLIRD